MLRTLVFAAGLGLVAAAAAEPPRYNVDANCRVTTKSADGTGESFAGCVRDETAAQSKIAAVWNAIKPSTRQTCGGDETRAKSYVELLTCVQMFEDAALLK
jgi:hypothetical protein